MRALTLAAVLLCAALSPASAQAQPDPAADPAAPDSAAAAAPDAGAPGPAGSVPVDPPAFVRGPRIPGTTLRYGDSLSMVRGRSDLRAVPDPDLAPGEVAYGGMMRFYGAPADAKLVFHDGRLARATFVLAPASARTRAYVEDDLRRMGYVADCRRKASEDRDCDWFGPLSATVRADTAKISADFGAAGIERVMVAEATPVARGPVRSLESIMAADSTPVLPDTLDLREPNPNGYPPPVLTKSAFARIPDEIRGEVQRGLVTVLAFVGIEGQVLYVEAIDGPEELRPVAEGAVMQYRFQRYAIKEGRRRFWVRVSVYPA